MKRVTISDIASACNVSTSTVSLILNNKADSFSEETRKRVLETAAHLNYKTSPMRESEGNKRLALLLPEFQDYLNIRLLNEIEKQAFHSGYSLILGNSNLSVVNEIFYINIFSKQKVNGIFMLKSEISQSVIQERLLREAIHITDIPLIKLVRDIPSIRAPFYEFDDEFGAFIGTKYLLDLGHRKIGFLTESHSLSTTQHKITGVTNCLTQFNLPLDTTFFYEGFSSINSGKRAYDYFENRGITAIFSFTDIMALGYYKIARERNKVIPKDISLLGYGDSPCCEYLDTPLSTISLPAKAMAKDAVAEIIALKSNQIPMDFTKAQFKPALIIRESTAPPSGQF